MYAYERINTHRPSLSRGPSRRGFSAALPWVFVLGVAAGTMLPVRHWIHGPVRHSVNGLPNSDSETIWRRPGNPDLHHPVDVLRTLDRDTFEARGNVGPSLDLPTPGRAHRI